VEPAKKPNRQWLSLSVVILVTLGALYLVMIGTRPARQGAAPSDSPRQGAAPSDSPRQPATPDLAPQRAAVDIAPSALYAASFPGLDGTAQALGKWQGQVIVLNFWATWCVPCREEMPIFDRVHKKLSGKGVVVVGLAADDKPKVATFLQASPVAYPILIGDFDALEFARRLGNKSAALPYTAIIDRTGNIVRTKLGPFTEAELEAQIQSVL
jgi:thiol-disulfide isomerase/thioredoxin